MNLHRIRPHLAFHNPSSLTGRSFGRLPAIDFRDRAYMLRPPAEEVTRTSRYWRAGQVLDQDGLPQCVAFAGQGFLLAGPVKNQMLHDPAWLYHECQLLDEWEGEDYDGTSVRALFKVLQREGLVSVYNWATDPLIAAQHILANGPVVFGTNWYVGMEAPDEHGFIHATGAVAGGHAYLIVGCNVNKKCPDGSSGAFRMQNSWGTDWGRKGRAWIAFSDAAKLIAEYGEVATSSELKLQERPAEEDEQDAGADPEQYSFEHAV